VIPQEILKNKDIKAIGKLIIHFLSEQKIEADGGIKTNAKKIADGIGEEQRNVKEHIKKLKKLNILNVKPGKYPIFYLKILIEHYSVPLNDLIVPYSVPLNPTTLLNKVVVVLLAKHGYEFGPATLKKLAEFSEQDQIRAIKSTARNSRINPEMYLNRILDNGCKGIRFNNSQSEIDPYKADKERLALLIADTKKAKAEGFQSIGYTIQ